MKNYLSFSGMSREIKSYFGCIKEYIVMKIRSTKFMAGLLLKLVDKVFAD